MTVRFGEETSPTSDMPMEEAHHKLEKFMSAAAGRDSTPIHVTVVSPYVSGMTLVDISGLDVNDAASIELYRNFIADESEPISVCFCMSPFDITSSDLAFSELRECFVKSGLPFSQTNVTILMSQLDLLIDPEYEQNVSPDATGRAWKVGHALQFQGKFAKAKLLSDDYPIIGIINPNTEVNIPSGENGLGPIDREARFMEANEFSELEGVLHKVGRPHLFAHINDFVVSHHIHRWVQEEKSRLGQERRKIIAALAELGEDPRRIGFVIEALSAFNKSVIENLRPSTEIIDETNTNQYSLCLPIVRRVAKDASIHSSDFLVEFPTEILNHAEQVVESAIENIEVKGTTPLNLTRFSKILVGPYKEKTREVVRGKLDAFVATVKNEIDLNLRLSCHLLGMQPRKNLDKNLVFILANKAAHMMQSLLNHLQEVNAESLKIPNVTKDFEDIDSKQRKKCEESIKSIDLKIALLDQLPSPPKAITFSNDGDGGGDRKSVV